MPMPRSSSEMSYFLLLMADSRIGICVYTEFSKAVCKSSKSMAGTADGWLEQLWFKWHHNIKCNNTTQHCFLSGSDWAPADSGMLVNHDDDVPLQIESKIFFCDAKTNTRGLYLKISEKKANRERSTIIVPGRSLPWFRELFNYYATTDPS